MNSTMNNQLGAQQQSYGPSTSYHYRPSTSNTITYISSNHPRQAPSEMPIRSTLISAQEPMMIGHHQEHQQQQQYQQGRRRFHKRKQMKRSKSVDLYQEPYGVTPSSMHHHYHHQPQPHFFEPNKVSRQQRSISREFLAGPSNVSPLSSSSSSSSIADIERVNQAVLLRHKSLDSMTFNRRTAGNVNGRDNHRRALSKPTEFDFDSDDSVCGIPKPRQ